MRSGGDSETGESYSLHMPRKIISRSKVRFAPVEAVEDWIAEASAQALKCRDRGHHRWGDDPYDVEGNRKKGFVRYYKCKCKALLAQYLDANGLVVDSKITYPDGYLLPKGSGRLSREDRGLIRLTSVESQMQRLAERQAS